MENNKDYKIWEDFKNGKEYALSCIYYHNIDFLFCYGKKLSTDEGLILDVIQDLFFYLIQKRKTLGRAPNIRMYLLKAFRRRLFKELKEKNSRRKITDNYQLEPQVVFSIEESIIAEEEESKKIEEIRRGIKKLSARQQEIMYYKFTCGFDYEQICEIMSISYELARKIVSRSVGILKKYLMDEELEIKL